MCLAKWLQLAGGIFELIGLLTVALGIAETRRAFTDRPSLVKRFLAGVTKIFARFRRKNAKIVAVSAAASLATAGKVRAVAKLGSWDGMSTEQKLERLKDAVQRHEDRIAELDEGLDREAEERKVGDKQEKRERDELRRLLEERIRLAAAGGLRLQVAGVLAFSIGLVLATWGNLIS